MKKKIKFSIVIPTLLLSVDRIILLLKNLNKIIDENEVIIVFQGNELDAYNKISKEFSSVKKFHFIYSRNIGISVARNMGIEKSKNNWIVLLDDDVSVHEDFFSSLESEINPSDLFYYGNVYVEGSFERYVNFYIKDRPLNYFTYNQVCSVALVFNKNIVKLIGYFDEKLGAGKYFGSCEESDFILRALNNNIEIKYLSKHNVWHPRASFPPKKAFSYGAGLGAMYSKHFRNAHANLKIKFICDILIRIILLVTLKPKRYIFLYGFLNGLVKFK